MGGEQGEGIGGAGRQDNVEGEAAGDFVEDLGDVGDRVRPGLEGGEVNGVGVGVIKLSAEAFDFCVEGAEAEVETFGFVAADVVVLDEREPGETEEVGVGGSCGGS
jgi:hypothetical protein